MSPEQMTAVLVAQQQLTEPQRQTLLDRIQATSDNVDLLALAHEQFGVNELNLLTVLAKHLQKSCEHVQLCETAHEAEALTHVAARDAWDYLILPLQIQDDGTLVCCTTEETLATALAYLMRTLSVPFDVVIADVGPLEQYIAEQYHYEGIDAA